MSNRLLVATKVSIQLIIEIMKPMRTCQPSLNYLSANPSAIEDFLALLVSERVDSVPYKSFCLLVATILRISTSHPQHMLVTVEPDFPELVIYFFAQVTVLPKRKGRGSVSVTL